MYINSVYITSTTALHKFEQLNFIKRTFTRFLGLSQVLYDIFWGFDTPNNKGFRGNLRTWNIPLSCGVLF